MSHYTTLPFQVWILAWALRFPRRSLQVLPLQKWETKMHTHCIQQTTWRKWTYARLYFRRWVATWGTAFAHCAYLTNHKTALPTARHPAEARDYMSLRGDWNTPYAGSGTRSRVAEMFAGVIQCYDNFSLRINLPVSTSRQIPDYILIYGLTVSFQFSILSSDGRTLITESVFELTKDNR